MVSEEEIFYIYEERIAIMLENRQPLSVAEKEGKRDAIEFVRSKGLTQIESFKLVEKTINDKCNKL